MHVSSKCFFYGHIGFLFFMRCMFLPSVFSMGISVFCSLCDACFFQVFVLWTYRFSVLSVMPVTSQCLFYRHIGFLFFMLCMFLPSVFSMGISVFCSLYYACFFQVFFLWTCQFSVLSVMPVTSKCLFYRHIGFLFFMLCMFLPSVFSMGISVFCSLCDACFFPVLFLLTYRFSVLSVMPVTSQCLFYRHIGFLFFL